MYASVTVKSVALRPSTSRSEPRDVLRERLVVGAPYVIGLLHDFFALDVAVGVIVRVEDVGRENSCLRRATADTDAADDDDTDADDYAPAFRDVGNRRGGERPCAAPGPRTMTVRHHATMRAPTAAEVEDDARDLASAAAGAGTDNTRRVKAADGTPAFQTSNRDGGPISTPPATHA